MKIVVTGGAGFIGSHLVDELVRTGNEVLVIDHYQREKLRFENPSATIHKISFGHESLEQIFAAERPDAVVHLAAQISVTASIVDPLYDAQRNILESLRLVQIAAKAGCHRFIFVSSGGAIYGDHPVRPTPLLDDAYPLSPYGVAKFSFEHYLEGFKEQYGLKPISLRFANVFGPRQQLKSTGEGNVMAVYLARIIQGEPVVIFGDGSATRDYVYVRDAVSAIIAALASDVTGIVNIGTGIGISVQEVYDTIMDIHGDRHPLIYEPFRKGEVFHSVIDPATGRESLGWEAKVSFREGMEKMYAWFMEHFGKRN
ncbi:MAG: NAD-dependent epimerase/dehydratase family protein [Patescibacteria group bacterium]